MSGQFIAGHRTPTTVDPHGLAVANAILPGDGFRRRHDMGLKYTLRNIIRSTGKPCMVECHTMFNGKIDSHVYHNYCSSGEEQIIPDLIVPDFEHGQDLLCEMKIFGIHSDHSNYSYRLGSQRMVSRFAKAISREYYKRTRQLDNQYYKGRPPGTIGPFTNALNSYYHGGITPLIGGAFGECNKMMDGLLKHCALHAAASREGLLLSPNTDISPLHSTCSILLHEYRTAVGCSVLKANINHKLHRLHYIRPSHVAATSTLATQRTRTKSSTQANFFSTTGDSGTYDEYYRFRSFNSHFGGFHSSHTVNSVSVT